MADKKQKKQNTEILGNNLNFAGKEAYNLLRTNLMFSVPAGERKGKVIGVTSSVHGEGKSLTSLNIAYSLACNNDKVLVIECDLRLPSLAQKLGLRKKGSGLSHMLAGMKLSEDVVKQRILAPSMDVILAGETPPNPSELLGSKSMANIIEAMAGHYDYVILDLPPVEAVSDALIVSQYVDAIVIVVRQDVTTSSDLGNTIRQLQYVGANIAGIVYNDASAKHKTKKGYYGHYKAKS